MRGLHDAGGAELWGLLQDREEVPGRLREVLQGAGHSAE